MDHEALIELFKNRPAMAAEMLREVLGQAVPTFKEARIESTALPEITPVDRRADLGVVLVDEDRRPLLAIVLAELEHWLRRAAVVSDARELFASVAS